MASTALETLPSPLVASIFMYALEDLTPPPIRRVTRRDRTREFEWNRVHSNVLEEPDRPDNFRQQDLRSYPASANAYDSLPPLQVFALVCRGWKEHARNVARGIIHQTLSVDVRKTATSLEMMETTQRVATSGSFVKELVFELRGFENEDDRVEAATDGSVYLKTFCTSVFSLVPSLQELNIWYPHDRPNEAIAVIIEAARERCPNLNSIVLPSSIYDTVDTSLDQERFKTIVDAAIEGPNARNLRELCLGVPFCTMPQPSEAATYFVMRMCDVCPNLEIVTGSNEVHEQMEVITSNEQWQISTATWERFCATLTQLKSFNWIVVPFASSFFETFGRYPKPQLRKLVMSTPMDWDWTLFHQSYQLPVDNGGYGVTARNAHAILTACPGLIDLEVAVFSTQGDPDDDGWRMEFIIPMGEDELDDGNDMDHWDNMMDPASRPQHPVPYVPAMMDPEVFDDEFCEALARNCKKLEKFTIVCWNETPTIMGFTDRAMQALASLRELRYVELASVNISGHGLFDLIVGARATHRQEFVVTVGDDMSTLTAKTFYTVVDEFLTKLVDCDPVQWDRVTRRVSLVLYNGCSFPLPLEEANYYIHHLRKLGRRVIAKHPAIRLRLLSQGYTHPKFRNPATCRDIIEFGFSIGLGGDAPGTKDGRQDSRIDDVVVNRGFLGRGSSYY